MTRQLALQIWVKLIANVVWEYLAKQRNGQMFEAEAITMAKRQNAKKDGWHYKAVVKSMVQGGWVVERTQNYAGVTQVYKRDAQ